MSPSCHAKESHHVPTSHGSVVEVGKLVPDCSVVDVGTVVATGTVVEVGTVV